MSETGGNKNSGDGSTSGVAVSETQVDGLVGEVLGPQEDLDTVDPLLVVQKMANRMMIRGFAKILLTIVSNIEKLHLPSVKLLMELAAHLQKCGSIREVEMQSFAVLLIKSLEAETTSGAGADAGANAGAGVVSVDV